MDRFSSLSISERSQLAMALLNDLPTSVVSQIVTQLRPRLCIDFVRYLPPELCLKILEYLDPLSLMAVARSCRAWYELAMDRKLWEHLYYLEGWKIKPAEAEINWKYLYTMRRRLETNWEVGKYVMFQFPDPDFPQEGHGECIYCLQYNAQFLVSGSRDRTIKIWNMQTRRLIRTLSKHRGSVLCLQFDSDPEEDIIVSGSSDSDVIIWQFSTGRNLQILNQAHRESVLNVKFDKKILVTCSKDKTIKIFNRKPLRRGDLGYREVDPVPRTVSPGYELLSTPSDVPVVPAWTMIGSLAGHNAAVNAVQIHGRQVVSASGDRHIKVWDWPSQVCTRTIVGHTKGIACVQYDGRRIVSGSSDNEIKVFDQQTGVEVASLRGHLDLVRTVQAGFGDNPWSEEDDAAEAKKVDKEYFEALQSGRLDPKERPRRGRRLGNAGSRRPEDITAFGAALPPGGGGGKYGRIVSGSYDRSIIIWRRDKEGNWRPQHHLKQEDTIPLHPSVRPALHLHQLQFDARRIICCSQSTIIVGWDFCNSDFELEEASRFFAAV